MMELKGPAEKTLYKGPHPGFTAKVNKAVDQVRDYDRYLRDPQNFEAIRRDLGYVPDRVKASRVNRASAEEPHRARSLGTTTKQSRHLV